MAASGKSTELRRAVSDGDFDLFGADFNSHFRNTCLPSLPVEDYLDTTDRILQRTWFHESDILKFRGREFPLESAVVHFELFWALFLGFSQSVIDFDSQSDADFAEAFRFFLSNESRVFFYFKRVLEDQPLGRSKLVVKILKPDYQDALRRFQAREAELDRKKNNRGVFMCSTIVYDGTRHGETIYHLIYSAWREAVLQRADTELVP